MFSREKRNQERALDVGALSSQKSEQDRKGKTEQKGWGGFWKLLCEKPES